MSKTATTALPAEINGVPIEHVGTTMKDLEDLANHYKNERDAQEQKNVKLTRIIATQQARIEDLERRLVEGIQQKQVKAA